VWTPAMGNDYGPVPESHDARPESDCPNRTVHWNETQVVLIFMPRNCSSYMERFDFMGIVHVATKYLQQLDTLRVVESDVHLCVTIDPHDHFYLRCTDSVELHS
jgi:hypothetical protein